MGESETGERRNYTETVDLGLRIKDRKRKTMTVV